MNAMAMTLRLTDEETEALRKAAEAEGRSMQEVAREAIRKYTGSWEQERERFLTEIVERDASLLRRLGEA